MSHWSYCSCYYFREIADLHRSNAAQDSKAHEAALSAEMQVREELKLQLDQERKSFSQEKEALIMQVRAGFMIIHTEPINVELPLFILHFVHSNYDKLIWH